MWKGFIVRDYFKRSNEHQIKTPLKFLNPTYEKDDTHVIANITSTTSNHGVNGWLEINPEWEDSIRENMLAITTDGEYGGTCFFQDFKFISTGHNNVIVLKNMNMKKICDEYKFVYQWLAKMFTLIYNTRFHTFNRSITHGNDFENEIIMMPIIACEKKDEIFEVDDKSYTLDVEMIRYILAQIKENHIKDIKYSYEEQLSFWESELDKLISKGFLENEYKNVKWKPYKVGDLFTRNHDHKISTPKKFLLTADSKSEKHPIAVVTASTANNGIDSWIEMIEDPDFKKHIHQNQLTIAMVGYAGACFYQTEPFVTTGNNNMIFIKDLHLKDACEENKYGYQWLAKMFTMLYMNKFHIGFKRTLARGNDFENEIIMMPMIKNEYSINMMSYIHIKSEIEIYKKKIKEFNENRLAEPFSLGKED